MKLLKQRSSQGGEKKRSKKWLFLGLGIAATGTLTFFGWRYWKRKKQQAQAVTDSIEPSYTPIPASTSKPKQITTSNVTNVTATSKSDAFPLKSKSKGANVKALQQYLIDKYGKSLLPKYGVDGDFGSETIAALKKVGLPESIDETTFNVLTKGSAPDAFATGSALYSAASSKDYNKTITLLKTLRNTDDYKAVSDAFSSYRLGNVRQTLVNGLLNTFTNETQKQAIRLEFSRMGLKYDGSKWSLSGIGEITVLITVCPSRVWKNPKNSVPVPANMVLGKQIARRGDFTLFENDRAHYLVQTGHVIPYTQS